MLPERIREYYRLCAIKKPDDRPVPLYDQLDERAKGIIFTKHTLNLYLREDGVGHRVKETVVGAKEYKFDQIGEKILVFV